MKKGKIVKKYTIELVTLLRKDYTSLSKKDPFQADILLKILEESEWRLRTGAWEMALEHSLTETYKYCIPLNAKTKKLIKEILEIYERPDWEFRGRDSFGHALEELKNHYNK